jgi:hypothetical protein
VIAAVELPTIGQLCIVRWIGRVSFAKVQALTICGATTDAADGVVQVPDSVFTEGKSWMSVAVDQHGHRRQLKPCPACKAQMK